MRPAEPVTKPLPEGISKVDDAVMVGEDLDFQRTWWRFETAAWWVLAVLLVADALGAFGHGWLAHAHASTANGALAVHYDRIEREGTPSMLTIHFGAAAARFGKIRLLASQSVVHGLGAERVIPQPEESEVGPRGITYVFPISETPATVSFELRPTSIGSNHVSLTAGDGSSMRLSILVLP